MELLPEAIAILQTFKNKNCKAGDVIQFWDLGNAWLFDAPEDKVDGIRLGFQQLLAEGHIVEHNAGLEITASGLNVLI
jgi:hypothetical protein